MLPGDRRHLGQLLYPRQIAGGSPLLQHSRQDHRVVVDDAVHQQPAALAPQLLLLLRPVAQLPEVRVGDRLPQLVVVLAPVQRPLHVLPQRRRVHKLQEMETAEDAVELQQRPLGAILRPVGAQLPHNDALVRRLERQRGEEPQQVVPLADDQLDVQLARWSEQQPGVLLGVLEAAQAGADLLLDLAVARGELVAEDVKQGEVQLVGAVGVGRVDRRLHCGGSISVNTTTGGALGNQQEFDPWDKVRSGGISQTSRNYTGQILDDTGLLFYNARYYDPGIGRFVSADTIVPGNASGSMDGIAVKPLTVDFHEGGFLSKVNGESKFAFWFQLDEEDRQGAGSPWGPANAQALNRYSYVLNNPQKYTDPSGHAFVPARIDISKWPQWAQQIVRATCAVIGCSVSSNGIVTSTELGIGLSTTVTQRLLVAPANAATATARHHIFNKFRGNSPGSQKYRDFFAKHGINVDMYAVEIPVELHKHLHRAGNNWTTRWKEWIDANPNATTKEVYQFAGKLMDEYGLSRLPIVPYR